MRPALILAALLAVSLPACTDGAPPSPPGKFICGTTFCDVTSELCVLSTGDAGARIATCTPAATFCAGMPACSCAQSECPGTCSQGDDGSVTVTCSN